MPCKKLLLIPLTLFSLSTFSLATVYSDGEDRSLDSWSVYDNTPEGATITNVLDSDKTSNIIEFKGEGRSNAYLLGNKDWNNSSEHHLKWSMNFSERFKISVFLKTSNGYRTLYYDHNSYDKGFYNDKYIKLGLGSKSMSGTWQSFSRDVASDLKKYDPSNSLLLITGFKVQGSGRMDDVRLEKEGDTPPTPPPSSGAELNEDAEDGTTDGWTIFDNNPSGATITNSTDADKNSKVIQLQGDGRANAYLFGEKSSDNKSDKHTLSWAMKISEKYKITVYTSTQKGTRSFVFTHSNSNKGLYKTKYIYLGLKAESMNGSWQNFSVNLADELNRYEPDNELFRINGFKVQGSGLFDDILVSDEGTPSTENPCLTFEALKAKINNNDDVTEVNTSCITDMRSMFEGAITFNQDLSNWDVSSVTNMNWMFLYAKSFNQHLSNWDVSSVTSMHSMFADLEAFNGNLSNWNVSSVIDMSEMFIHAESFNQDLSKWNVSSVTTMHSMFESAPLFNQNLSNWDVSSVKKMQAMFHSAFTFNQDLSHWNVSSITDMEIMFAFATSFNQDLSKWDVSSVINMGNIFHQSGLSTDNYDKLLIAWSKLDLQYNVPLGAKGIKYSSNAAEARQILIDKFGWIITDDGQVN